MARGYSEFSTNESENNFNYGSSRNSSNNNNDAGNFECNICLELAQDPIVTLCGHLYCWPCLYEWLHVHSHASECPVCKAVIEEDRLVPLYGRGKTSTDPRSKSRPGVNIPNRPTGQRPATAPPPEANHFPHVNPNPWFVGGAPMASTRFGNYTFSAAIGGLFPLLNFHVHGFPDATAYGPGPGPAAAAAAGYPYGYGHSFHGGHAHGFPRQMVQGQQLDNYLKALLFMIDILPPTKKIKADVSVLVDACKSFIPPVVTSSNPVASPTASSSAVHGASPNNIIVIEDDDEEASADAQFHLGQDDEDLVSHTLSTISSMSAFHQEMVTGILLVHNLQTAHEDQASSSSESGGYL